MKVEDWHNQAQANKVVEALMINEFDAAYMATSEEAVAFIMEHVKSGSKVGFGGSVTIKKMGMHSKVEAAGGIVVDHGTPGLNAEERVEVARQELLTDVFLCSSNAITMDGKLVNVDAMGNRVGALSFGPKKVIVVVSADKICKDEKAAFERLECVAGPKTNKRLNQPNPCTKTGVCMDCKTATRLCRVYSVMRKRPRMSDITVLVLGESLGF